MLTLHAAPTPNGIKLAILLEELGEPWQLRRLDLARGDTRTSAFLALNPVGKMPVLVDEGTGEIHVESGAMMMWLCDRTGRLLPADGAARRRVIEALFWQVGDVGPTFGHAHHFLTYHPGTAPAAEGLFTEAVARIYATLEVRLAAGDHVAGALSVADVALWPWVSRFDRHRIRLHNYPGVRRWYQRLADRPAFAAGYAALENGPIPRP